VRRHPPGRRRDDVFTCIGVHELVPLLEATHNARFVALMDRFTEVAVPSRGAQPLAGAASEVELLNEP